MPMGVLLCGRNENTSQNVQVFVFFACFLLLPYWESLQK